MQINEIFLSIQGESINSMPIPMKMGAGVPTVFIRTNNCSVQCDYCDTKYTWEKGDKEKNKDMTPDEIVAEVQRVGGPYKVICLTGGEPELQPISEIQGLITKLKDIGYIISVEASGTKERDFFHNADSIVMDIKGPSAGKIAMKRTENCMGYARTLGCCDQLKFLVKDREDFDWMMGWLTDSGIIDYEPGYRPQILVSPEFDDDGSNNAAEVVEWMLDAKLDATLNFQIHKIIWDINKRAV